MKKGIKFTVRGKKFEGVVYTNPFMFGRIEAVDVWDGRTRNYVRRTVRVDSNDELFFTWNGKTVVLKEMIDHFECVVR